MIYTVYMIYTLRRRGHCKNKLSGPAEPNFENFKLMWDRYWRGTHLHQYSICVCEYATHTQTHTWLIESTTFSCTSRSISNKKEM